jgi:Na+/proline symporter
MTGSALAVGIVVAYLLLMLGIALRYRRFASQSLDHFFLGGRKIPGWLNGVSYTAALISPDAATAYGGLAVVTGGFICWWYLSRFGLALFVGAVLFALFWRRLGLFTSLQFYELRFPPRAAAAMSLWIAIRTSLVAMPAWTGITLLASCKILEPALGFTPLQTLVLVVPVSFVYVFLAGYQGVVVSNFIQMAVFGLGALTLAGATLVHFGGPAGMAAAVGGMNGETADALRVLPPADHAVFPLAAALAWLAGQTIGYGGDAAPMGGAMEGQRILSTRTPAEAVTMYVVAALSLFLLLLLVTLPCLGAAAMWPELRGAGADRELAYGRLMKEMLPPAAMGLMVAAMLAAAMSTVADNLNFGSQVLVSDLYRRWIVRNAAERHYLLAGRVGMLLILGLALAVAAGATIIFDVAVFMLQLSAAELPANWAQWWWWRFNGPARLAASFGGAAVFGVVVLGPKLLLALGVPGAAALIPGWWWQTFIVMGLTTTLWVAVALLTKPDPEPLLRAFHDRARPLGGWGPFRTAAPDRGGDLRPIVTGFGTALLGAAAAACLILGLTEAWIGRFAAAAVFLASAAVLFAGFRACLTSCLRVLDRRFPPVEAAAHSPVEGESPHGATPTRPA